VNEVSRWSEVKPAALGEPALVIFNPRAGAKLGLARPSAAAEQITALLTAAGVRSELRSTEAPMVSIANGPFVGAAYAIAPEARVDDGVLDVVDFHGASVLRLLVHLFAIAGGRSLPPPPEASHLRVRSVQVSTRQRRPLPVRADGEPLGVTPTGFELVPSALRVIVGSPDPSSVPAWAPT
jgi:diacylglycerol kinase family enzyme